MNIGIIVAVLIYFVVSIAGVGIYVSRRRRALGHDGSFALGGRSLGVLSVGVTLVLIMLGSGHTTGVFEGAHFYGWGQVWFVAAHGFLLVIVAGMTGIWARRMRITSLGETIKILYGEQLTILIAALNIVVGWVVVSCETQAMGIIVNALTGLDLNAAALIGGILGLFYILMGGMKQNAILNMINIVIFYASFVIAIIYVAMVLPNHDFTTIETFYVQSGQTVLLDFTGGPGFLLLVALPNMLSPIFCHATGQVMLQTCASAKNEKSLRRAALFVGPLNAIIGVISVTLALTAKALPQYAGLDPKLMTTQMLIDVLPSWVITLMLAAFMAALLSSFAGFVMSAATTLAIDYVKGLFKPDMDDRQETLWIRIFLIIGSIIGIALAQALPPIIMLFTWLYSFLVPVFFVYVFGLWWKRNLRVGVLACVVPWIVSTIWTFTPLPSLLGMEGVAHLYITLVLGIVILVIGNLTTEGEIGYFRSKEYFGSEGYKLYLEEKKAGNV